MAPGESTPEKTAPQPLYLVQRFVNSVDLESGEDELSDPDALSAWLAERGLLDAREAVSKADLRRAIDAREGLRAVLLTHNGMPLDEARLDRLDRAVSKAGVRLHFSSGREPELVPDAAGVDGALARLMAIIAAAVEQGGWERLKACPGTSASGPSTTARRTAPAAGARWTAAATSRRRGPSASAAAAPDPPTPRCGP